MTSHIPLKYHHIILSHITSMPKLKRSRIFLFCIKNRKIQLTLSYITNTINTNIYLDRILNILLLYYYYFFKIALIYYVLFSIIESHWKKESWLCMIRKMSNILTLLVWLVSYHNWWFINVVILYTLLQTIYNW